MCRTGQGSGWQARAVAPMGDLFDDPDVAGALAHCSSDWGANGLGFGGDSPEEASFFDASVALPEMVFSGGAPHACPRTPPGPPVHMPQAGMPLAHELGFLPSPPAVPPLPAVQMEHACGDAPVELSCTPGRSAAEQHAAAPRTPVDVRLQPADNGQRQSTPSRSAKRRRGSVGSEGRLDSAMERLQHEYEELLNENRELQGKCAAAQAQVAGAQRKAATERQTLAVLIAALAPHKASLVLAPQESVASTLSRFGSCSLPSEQEQEGPADAKNQGGAKGPDEALAEAVAAAALAVNKGNPAGALLDLMALVVRGSTAPTSVPTNPF
ncbi:hypothetical protein WJX81_001867 [Elliptochloris bilobata]|uniref:BZIP domain-containing protein n=1 Tax=Elliptochloris bilobata TaxID=381761 RepID=A0AAW1RZU1_9CHLO